MTALVIDIVNSALRRVGQEEISISDFDTGIEKHHYTLRESVQEIWQELADLQTDDSKVLFERELVSRQATYQFDFHPSQLANLTLWLDGESKLAYLSEDQARTSYPSLSDIPSGKPHSWFVSTSSTEAQPELVFLPKPDSSHTITGMIHVQHQILKADDQTTCHAVGDKCIRLYLEWILRLEGGFNDATFFENRFQSAWSDYLVLNSKKRSVQKFYAPYQD